MMHSWTFFRRKEMELYREEQCVVRKEIIFPATQWDGYLLYSSMELSNGTG
jgi:hypothetical protein